jgi:hypothetical protein
MIRIDALAIVSFSVIAIIVKINTKMKIKVVNNIPNNRLKFVCVISMPGPYISSRVHGFIRFCVDLAIYVLYQLCICIS